MPRGGDRRPNNPAPVAMPGAMSRRTDGGPADKQPVRDIPGGAYGEGKEMRQIQGGAPMAESGGAPQGGGPAPQRSLDGLLDEPTQNPDEPLTAGADFGPGVGPAGAGIPGSLATQDAKHLREYLPMLEWVANQPNSNPSTRAMVRVLKGKVGI